MQYKQISWCVPEVLRLLEGGSYWHEIKAIRISQQLRTAAMPWVMQNSRKENVHILHKILERAIAIYEMGEMTAHTCDISLFVMTSMMALRHLNIHESVWPNLSAMSLVFCCVPRNISVMSSCSFNGTGGRPGPPSTGGMVIPPSRFRTTSNVLGFIRNMAMKSAGR